MINLKIAFHKHPMPLGWELRVAAATGIPYWVSTYAYACHNWRGYVEIFVLILLCSLLSIIMYGYDLLDLITFALIPVIILVHHLTSSHLSAISNLCFTFSHTSSDPSPTLCALLTLLVFSYFNNSGGSHQQMHLAFPTEPPAPTCK
jgi:hypothetical protein